MRKKFASILILLACSTWLPALADDNKHGIGAAYVGGVVDCDSCPDKIDFTGFAIFGKIGLTKNWGLLVTYRDVKDDENLFLNEEDTVKQAAVQGVYMWRPSKTVRPHIKFGIERTEFTAKIPGLGEASEDDVALAVGGGFEAGSQSVAFLLDYDFTIAEISNEDFNVGNLDLGIIFKF